MKKIDQPSEEAAFALEIELIKKYGRKDNGTGILCNLTDGGEGSNNRSRESIEKTAVWHRGRKRSNKSRQRMSRKQQQLRLNGLITSDETKQKMRNDPKRKQKQSEQTKLKRNKVTPKRQILQMDLDYNVIKKWESMSDATRTLNIHITSLYRSCYSNGKQTAGNFRWKYLTKNKRKTKHIVAQYTLDDQFIRYFNTTKEAANAVNVDFSCIIYCCNGKIKTSAGFKWKYVPVNYKPRKGTRAVLQFTLNNQFIAEYPSGRQAALSINYDAATITKCCNGSNGIKSAGGFKWKWKDSI